MEDGEEMEVRNGWGGGRGDVERRIVWKHEEEKVMDEEPEQVEEDMEEWETGRRDEKQNDD